MYRKNINSAPYKTINCLKQLKSTSENTDLHIQSLCCVPCEASRPGKSIVQLFQDANVEFEVRVLHRVSITQKILRTISDKVDRTGLPQTYIVAWFQ